MSDIVIGKIDIEVGLQKVKEFESEDDDLIKAIDNVEKNLEGKDIEVFMKEKNIIAAEDGYYVTVYKSNVNIENE